MLYDHENYVDSFVMMRELFASIRDTNRRLCEIKNMLIGDYIKDDELNFCKARCLMKDDLECKGHTHKDMVKKRYLRLMDTRFSLIYSIYDIRKKFIKQLSEDATKEKIEKVFAIENIFRDLKNL